GEPGGRAQCLPLPRRDQHAPKQPERRGRGGGAGGGGGRGGGRGEVRRAGRRGRHALRPGCDIFRCSERHIRMCFDADVPLCKGMALAGAIIKI
ncbi:unnamed protein product, partial [Heterosigma akashiwo]